MLGLNTSWALAERLLSSYLTFVSVDWRLGLDNSWTSSNLTLPTFYVRNLIGQLVCMKIQDSFKIVTSSNGGNERIRDKYSFFPLPFLLSDCSFSPIFLTFSLLSSLTSIKP